MSTTTVYAVRTRRDTNEIVGILQYSDPAMALAAAAEDAVYAHNTITVEQFHHLQNMPGYDAQCAHTDPTCNIGEHRYEGGKLIAKSKLVLTVDKYNITINTDTATVSWAAGKPIFLTVNGNRIPQPVTNSLPIKASFSGQYRIQVDDPEYYSDVLTINAEEPVSG